MDIFSDKSNRLVFGVSGSGKATYTKDEMYQILTKTLRDKIVVVDTDYEYISFAKKFSGDVITLRLDEKMYFNICDLVIDWKDTEGCLKRKILLLISATACAPNATRIKRSLPSSTGILSTRA